MMNCPDCLDVMVMHRHEEWPKMTYHCACGMVTYRNQKKEKEVLVDPTDALLSQDGVPIEALKVNTPQYAHRYRQEEVKGG